MSGNQIKWTVPDAKTFQEFLRKKFPEMIDTLRVETTLDLLRNQKIVANFLREETPYRGLLLYHGLGSGKSAASITIAEGYVNRHVVVMLPASLSINFRHELKHFKTKNKYTLIHYNSPIAVQSILMKLLPSKIYQDLIHEAKGLTDEADKISFRKGVISKQERLKGKSMNDFLEMLYDPSREIDNPFDNKTIIIDEVHNLTSMIIGGGAQGELMYEMMMNAKDLRLVCLSGTPAINSIYELAIMLNLLRGYMSLHRFVADTRNVDANNITRKLRELGSVNRIYINPDSVDITRYPLHFVSGEASSNGSIHRSDTDNQETDTQFKATVQSLLESNGLNVLEIDDRNIPLFPDILHRSNEYQYKKRTSEKHTKQSKQSFLQTFLNEDMSLKNPDLFKKRVLGLVSFFSGVDKSMFPALIQNEPLKIDMSDYQCKQYALDRRVERVLEKKQKSSAQVAKATTDTKSSASYFRVLSRQSSLFTFPPINVEGKALIRPRAKDIRSEYKTQHENDENELSLVKMNIFVKKQMVQRLQTLVDDVSKWSLRPFDLVGAVKEFCKSNSVKYDDLADTLRTFYGKEADSVSVEDVQLKEFETKAFSKVLSRDLASRLEQLMNVLQFPLEVCSPKFIEILSRMNSSPGLMFAYSQFRSAEGIEMFKQVLIAFGYKEYNELETPSLDVGDACRYSQDDSETWSSGRVISKDGDMFEVKGFETQEVVKTTFAHRATFALWTGSESKDKKKLERVQKEFNSPGNKYGQKIVLLLATESGAEGISLKHVRQVHVFEPFWNEVRIAQVVGRARRVNSHAGLPESQRNVSVFNYVSTFSKEQLARTWASDWTKSLFKPSELIQHDEIENDVIVLDEDVRMKRAQAMIYTFTDEFVETDSSLTSDQMLMKIAAKKDIVIQQFLVSLKEAAVDCALNKLANVKNDIDVDCVETIIQEGDYTYEPEITEQSADKFQNVRRVKKKEFFAVVKTPLFRAIVPLKSSDETIDSIEDERDLLDYYVYYGIESDKFPRKYKKKIGVYSKGKTTIEKKSDKAKWVVLERILKSMGHSDDASDFDYKTIREQFATKWNEYQNITKENDLEQILAMRKRMINR